MSSIQKAGAAIMSKTAGNFGAFSRKTSLKSGKSIGNSTVGGSKLSHDSFKEQFEEKNRKDFINEANKIMRERMKNRGSTINSKSKYKSVVLLDTKEICLKNYLIGLLKEKRTDLNEKEKNITKALKDSEIRLEYDYKKFVDFVEYIKKEQKEKEEDLLKLKSEYDERESVFKRESAENKRLNEDLERTVKKIGILKSYGSFVYKVLRRPFWFEDIPDVDQRERNFETVAQKILNKYQFIKENKLSMLEDEGTLIYKFSEFEERVLGMLENKEMVDKEVGRLKDGYIEEINELQRRYEYLKQEEKRYITEKHEIKQEIYKLNPKQNYDIEKCFEYICELGASTGDMNIPKNKSKMNILDYLALTQQILGILSNKEKKINDYIDEIEYIEEYGNKKEIIKIEGERKKEIKREKQKLLKQKQEELEALKLNKAVERAERVYIRGRKVPKEYPINKERKKTNIDNNNNKNTDYEMLYYSDDEF